MQIKNVLFDLGGVLLNLDISRTEAAFEGLVGNRALHRKLYTRLVEEGFLEDFERGAVDTEGFTKKMQQINPYTIMPAQVHAAWSAMLLDFPVERLDLLQRLKNAGYRIFLLSNINTIHLRDVYEIVKLQHGLDAADFDAIFERAYYSHQIKRRKPDVETYQFVCEDAQISPNDTLFIDDNAQNIIGAQRAGLLSHLHATNSSLERTLRHFLDF